MVEVSSSKQGHKRELQSSLGQVQTWQCKISRAGIGEADMCLEIPELLCCSQGGWWPRPAGLVGSVPEVLKTRRDDQPRVDEAEEHQLGVCQAGGSIR